MTPKYQPNWRSLRQHTAPQWFRDAKFGIYTHWGIYSVPAIGPNTSWYGHDMYRGATEQHAAHVKRFGPVEEFGYKDFIPQFTAEKFDADQWAEVFHNAGARFAGPVAEHHDGFSMWPTKTSRWNAGEMGPKRDVVGELERAIRSRDMKYMVAMHHAEHWWFFPHWMKGTDAADPRYADFYGEPHNTDLHMPDADWDREREWAMQDKPSAAFLKKWYDRLVEVVEGYQPDYIWFDFGLKYVHEQLKQDFLAYYYNKGLEWDREVLATYKWDNLPPGTATVDIELGRMSDITYFEWITDTTVDAGNAWGYMEGAGYKSPGELIHYLVDNVSKNGYMLLNVGPKADGTLPDEALQILAEMGRWLGLNGEAIYGTTPWYQFGEGPTRFTVEGAFGDMSERLKFTGEDFRFTVRENLLYAMAMAWPDRTFTIRSLADLYPGEVERVELLGHDGSLGFRQTAAGLEVDRPASAPGDHCHVFRITRRTGP